MARDLAQEQCWRNRTEECCQSGLSIKNWCVQKGLKITAYHYWVRKFKRQEQLESGDNPFAEVVLPPKRENSTKETTSLKAEFFLSFGDYCIGIPDGFNPATSTKPFPSHLKALMAVWRLLQNKNSVQGQDKYVQHDRPYAGS